MVEARALSSACGAATGEPFLLTGCTELSWLERNKQTALVALVLVAILLLIVSLAALHLHFRRKIPTLFILCSTPERGLGGENIMEHAVRIAKRFGIVFQIIYDQKGSSNNYEQRDKHVDWSDSDSVAGSSCASTARQALAQKRPPSTRFVEHAGSSLTQASICAPR